MSIREDLIIDWEVSPRIIEVAKNGTESTQLTIQDLYDTIRHLSAQPEAIDKPEIIDGSGKEELGGGVLVGLTIKLFNARVKFEDRSSPTICDISGGNLVAVDENGDIMNPIQYATNITVTYAQSSSATAIEAGGALTNEEHEQLMLKIGLESTMQSVKSQADKMQFIGEDIKATLDNEKVNLDDKTKEKIEVTQKDMQHTKRQADFIRNIEEGRWLIKKNQMIFYGADNKTVIAKFNLYDKDGRPTEQNVFERRRV